MKPSKQIAASFQLNKQAGNVLFISLVLLAVLTILGLSSMRTALTEEKIARNIQDLNLAQESAESGLRHGQRMLKNNVVNNDEWNNGNGATDTTQDDTNIDVSPPDLQAWTASTTFTPTAADLDRTIAPFTFDSAAGASQAFPLIKLEKFFVNHNGDVGGPNDSLDINKHLQTTYYRVISRGEGLGGISGKSEVILESIVITGTK